MNKKKAVVKYDSLSRLYLFYAGIYTRLSSLTTFGVVRGATRRMYMP